MSDPIRVLIVDDHAVVRAGLRLLIEREGGMVVVDEAANANEAIFRAIEHKPDVLLVDVTMPGESGIEAIPKLLEASPASKVLVLSMHDDPRYVREAFAAGASRLRAEGGGRRRGGGGDPRGCRRRQLRQSRARRAHGHGRGARSRPRPRPTRSRSVSTRCCACSPWATRTRRSRRRSTSPCAPRRRTGRTSCGSSVWRRAPSSFATRSPSRCSSPSSDPSVLSQAMRLAKITRTASCS